MSSTVKLFTAFKQRNNLPLKNFRFVYAAQLMSKGFTHRRDFIAEHFSHNAETVHDGPDANYHNVDHLGTNADEHAGPPHGTKQLRLRPALIFSRFSLPNTRTIFTTKRRLSDLQSLFCMPEHLSHTSVPEDPSSTETHESNEDGSGVGGEEPDGEPARDSGEQQRSRGEQQKSGGDLRKRVSELEKSFNSKFSNIEKQLNGFKTETRGYFYFLIMLVVLGTGGKAFYDQWIQQRFESLLRVEHVEMKEETRAAEGRLREELKAVEGRHEKSLRREMKAINQNMKAIRGDIKGRSWF